MRRLFKIMLVAILGVCPVTPSLAQQDPSVQAIADQALSIVRSMAKKKRKPALLSKVAVLMAQNGQAAKAKAVFDESIDSVRAQLFKVTENLVLIAGDMAKAGFYADALTLTDRMRNIMPVSTINPDLTELWP